MLLTGLLMAGCKHGVQTVTENNIQFDSIQVEKVYHLLGDQNNPNCELHLKYLYPVRLGDADILKEVQELFIRSFFGEGYESVMPEEAVKRYVEQYIDDYKDLEDDFLEERDHEHEGDPGAWFSYYEYTTNEITFNKNNLLCYAINYENFTGGAHGSHTCVNYIVDLSTGAQLTEKEIFTDNFQDALAKIFVHKLAKKNKVDNVKELENMGYFSIDEIYPNDNFAIDETGITYYFNEYEIAAFAVGTTSIHLPFEEIAHLLRPDSPIRVLVD
jgi:hypothetical protein